MTSNIKPTSLNTGLNLPKTALVTGSAKGMGRAMAVALAQEGFNVVVHYRSSKAEAQATTALCIEAGVRAVYFAADLTQPAQAAKLIEQAQHAFAGSPLGVLVNTIGNYVHKPLLETSDEDWADMLGSNLSATLYTCRAAVPYLQSAGWGRIVNFGYAGAKSPEARPNIVPYLIAKTGVLQLSRSLAVTLAGSGISVNVISPGVIETSRGQPIHEIPAKRLGTVAEVVDTLLYFVRASDYITGQELEVSGGWNL